MKQTSQSVGKFNFSKILKFFFLLVILLTIVIPMAGLGSMTPLISVPGKIDIPSGSYQVYGSGDIHKIKHVVVIIEENQAFDTIFGTYPYGYTPIVNNITDSVMKPEGLYKNVSQLENSGGVLHNISVPKVPWLPVLGDASPYYANGNSTIDPYEGWSSYHGDYWFDTEDGFYYYSGPQSLAYFSYEQVGILWDYAEEYSISDNYFAPVMGFTEPNRIAYLLGEPANIYSDSADNVAPFNQTIMAQLQDNNISWGYYAYDLEHGQVPWPVDEFSGSYSHLSHFGNLTEFRNELNGTGMPDVSWVMFLGGSNDRYDMHPPYNIMQGSEKLASVIDSIESSKYWNSTAVFITFDEGGGYYDQITPPSIDHFGLGQRIPLIVISPYAREAFIGNQTVSGYSLLGFIDQDFNLPYLTATVRESNSAGILQMFNLTRNPRGPIMIDPGNWTYPMKLQYPVDHGYFAVVHDHTGYASVYPAPEMNYLLPLEIIAFALVAISFRFRKLVYLPLPIFISTLGISAYINNYHNIYSFIAEYYLFSSLIGLLVAIVIAFRHLRKNGYLNRGTARGGT